VSPEQTEHAVGTIEDLPPGAHRIVRVANREIGVFNIDGSVHAIPNLCPHQRGPLCAGTVSGTIDYGAHTGWQLAWIWEGEVVTCPWHSLEFHVPTGQCIALADIRLRTFEVRVSDEGEIRVVI
jgi:nitrite reductase (NADH) small subunit